MTTANDNNSQQSQAESQARLLEIFQQARLPLMAAPMFLVTGPELVVAAARAGLSAIYPSPNSRNIEDLDQVMHTISTQAVNTAAPWGLNMIVHSSYDRFDDELALVKKYKPSIVSTALGSPKRVVDHVHAYGGVVIADVIDTRLARKAADAGVDGLILVTHGAGGHTGTLHPMAFIREVREFWSGPLGLAGAITSGQDILNAQLMGADFAVAGTRFIATEESRADQDYREMLVHSSAGDLVASKAVSGVLANWLKPTLERAGLDMNSLQEDKKIDFSGDISTQPKAWKHVWSAGQGLAGVTGIQSVQQLVEALSNEYGAAIQAHEETLQALRRRYL